MARITIKTDFDNKPREAVIEYCRQLFLRGWTQPMIIQHLCALSEPKNTRVLIEGILSKPAFDYIHKYLADRPSRSQLATYARKTCQIEDDGDRKAQQDLMYERYLSLYRDAKERGNLLVAKNVLDSLSKLLGLNEAEKVEIDKHNIQITLV